jgi:NADH-quinone oxidoreductase subunit L
VIDGDVNGSAEVTADVGGILRRIQSGYIRSYAAWVLLGAVVWMGYLLLR